MTTIRLYKTRLNPADVDRPGDMYTYLRNCPQISVTVDRDLCIANLSELEVEAGSSGVRLFDCNYMELQTSTTANFSWYYFITGMRFSTMTAATLTLQVDPWGCYVGFTAQMVVERHSMVLRAPQPRPQYNNVVDYSAGVDGYVFSVNPFFLAGGTVSQNSYDGRGIPVAFCEVSDGFSSTSKSYPITVFTQTVSFSYQNASISEQVELLTTSIKQINAAGTYSITVTYGTTTKTIQNAIINKIVGIYIVPFYALKGLYGSSTFYNNLSSVGSLLYDDCPIGRSFSHFVGEERTVESSNYRRCETEARKLYVGNGFSAVHIQRGGDYNGAELRWAMDASGFSLAVAECDDNNNVTDLTSAIFVPNSSTSFMVTDVTTDAEKALSRIASGTAIVGGVAAVAGGVLTANPLAVVAGAGTTARAVSGIVSSERNYKGEGANGYVSQGSGVNFDAFHQLTSYFVVNNGTPTKTTIEIPIVSVYEIDSAGSEARRFNLFYNGSPVGDIPLSMTHYAAPLDILVVQNTAVNDGFDFWLFDKLILRYDSGEADLFVPAIVEMLTTRGVRIWDTTTAEKCEKFKRP